MHLKALLDLDVVALEAEDEISVLLELTAPDGAPGNERAPGTLEVVLDRSGSMADGRLEAAKGALEALIARLDPRDNFGLVTFDDVVTVDVPAGPLADKEGLRRRIRSFHAGSTTNLAGGYLRGLQEARRVAPDGRPATVLLLSDGHANVGVTDPVQLGRVAEGARQRGVTTSTIGLGLGYDEALMATIARGGAGNTHFAEEADTAGAVVAAEVEDLLEQVVQAASLTVRPSEEVAAVRLYNDLPAAPIEGGFMVELGDFYAREERKLLLRIDVPALRGLGLAQVCELELCWTDARTMEQHTVTLPVHVNVVPGDAASGRLPNPQVRSEVAFQEAQRAKREATEHMRRGDHGRASQLLNDASLRLASAAADAPDGLKQDLSAEAGLLDGLASRAMHDDPRRLSKWLHSDAHFKERKRGRRHQHPSG